MLNQTCLEEKLEVYKKDFIPHWKKEKFKWEAVKTFQDNWNIEADDFAEMFKRSIAKTNNLLTSKNYFAKGMIEGFADAAPEETRAMFRKLFDENQDMGERIIKFRDDSEEIRKKFTPDAKQSFQDAFAASVYLWLRYPDKHYIFKFGVMKTAAKQLESDYKFKRGAYAANFQNNTAFLDEICAYIKSDTELISLFQSQLTDDCYPDPEFKTLAFDVGFFIGQPSDNDESEKGNNEIDDERSVHYWLYSPGTNAEYWDEFFNANIMAIGWEEIGDLSEFVSKEEIAKSLQEVNHSDQTYRNDALAMWQFVHEIQPDDIVFAKKGRQQVVGRGVVESDYFYDADREYYRNVRCVKWSHNEEHTIQDTLAMKTLTDITQYKELVGQLNDLFQNNELDSNLVLPTSEDSNHGYWWLVADPTVWRFSGIKIGEEEDYTLYTEKGNKRHVFQNFLDAKAGDSVIGYEATPVKKIVALAEITKENDGENLYFEKTEDLSVPIDYAALKEYPELKNMEFFSHAGGSLFKLTKQEYDFIMDLIRKQNPVEESGEDVDIESLHSKAEFVQWCEPLVETLLKMGGSGKRPDVHKEIIQDYDISKDELDKKNASGGSHVLNEIDWARNYLVYEGFISNEENGVWMLTDLGKSVYMTEELAEKIVAKWVKIKTAEREHKPVPHIDLSPLYVYRNGGNKKVYPSYDKADFLEEVYMSAERYDTLRELLLNKMNIILQGAPGVGKTFTAKRLAYSIMGEKDDSRIELIQFHQNYSYEDFIMGYRPDGADFKLMEGVFYLFCQKARKDPERKYFFIIDEINRGNLSKIFGELLMLIEKDYRETSVTLAYNGQPFSVPKNLYIIGMMNTADRSLAMIDYALRRRFSFFDIEPGFDSDGFKKYQASLANKTFDALIKQMKALNEDIKNDQSLGKGFMIGHSYFCGRKPEECTTEWMKSVVEFDILPMLSEYWFDDPEKYKRWERNLHGVFDDE